jgi:hypothetical protein
MKMSVLNDRYQNTLEPVRESHLYFGGARVREVKDGAKYRSLRELNRQKFNQSLRARGVTIL